MDIVFLSRDTTPGEAVSRYASAQQQSEARDPAGGAMIAAYEGREGPAMLSRREVFQSLLTTPILLSRTDAEVTPALLRYRPEIEPLVAAFETVPRQKSAELLADYLRRGTPYRQLMAALFLAAVRNINPRPPGFALHAVFVIHSAHLIGMEAPPDARVLPLFYALDNFKAAQERDAKQTSGDYSMQPIRGPLPSGARAAADFAEAMEAWDAERAERAVVSLARNGSAAEVFEMLRRYGARDYRNIGHKAIFVANAYRTLDAIGWQDAEPVLRSLVLGLLDFGRQQQVNGYKFDDQCYLGNLKHLKATFPKLDPAWSSQRSDAAGTRAMVELLRTSEPGAACDHVAASLRQGKAAADMVWDAVHLAAAELAMRARGGARIVGIHAVTSANGLHHAYLAAASAETRFLVLLQAVGWMGQFRKWTEAREENLPSVKIENLEPAAGNPAVAEIFAGVPERLDASTGMVMRLARDIPARQAFLTAALRFTLTKADEVHYYKYLAALIEDIALVSTRWQPHLHAAVLYYVKGANDRESPVMERARAVIKSLSA
jgi:hypothetical protein